MGRPASCCPSAVMGTWTAQTAVMRGTAQVSTSPVPSLIPAPCQHTDVLSWLCDLALTTSLIYLPLLSKHLSPAGTNFPAASALTICLPAASETENINHFRMDGSKAGYFTLPTGDMSLLLCPALQGDPGDVARALLPSLGGPVGAEGQSPPWAGSRD